MTRYSAALTHLLISAVLAGTVFALVILAWYPPPLFAASGGKTLLMILICVDVVLGPLITLMVFRPGKPSLRFDLACIALLQTGALIYGIHTVFVARPVFLVFVIDRFEVVTAVQIPPEEQAKAADAEFRHSPLWGYRTVAAVLPSDQSERNRILFASVGGVGLDIQHFPQHYRRYDPAMASAALKSAQEFSFLRTRDPQQNPAIDAWLKEQALDEKGLVVLPVIVRSHDLTAVLDRASGRIIQLAPFSLW